MSPGLAKFFTVTAYELVDAFRSKRALILLVLYLMGSVGSSLLFIHTLHEVETQAVEAMGLNPSNEAGSATQTLWKSKYFKNMIVGLVRDRDLAEKLLSIPPIALFYSWLALTFTPMLVVLLVSSRIAEEVSTASVRFVLFRTDCASWCLGKLAGQSLMLMAALLLSGLGAWATAWIRMKYFEPGPAAFHILIFSVKAWIYAMSYLGMALGVSQLFKSPALATATALAGLIMLALIAGVCAYFQTRGNLMLWSLVQKITPRGHVMDLWFPEPGRFLPASIMLLTLCFVYFLSGYAYFVRKDQ